MGLKNGHSGVDANFGKVVHEACQYDMIYELDPGMYNMSPTRYS